VLIKALIQEKNIVSTFVSMYTCPIMLRWCG